MCGVLLYQLKVLIIKYRDMCAYFVCSVTHKPFLKCLQGLFVLGACVGLQASPKSGGVCYFIRSELLNL